MTHFLHKKKFKKFVLAYLQHIKKYIAAERFNPYHPNPEKIDDFYVACSIGHKQIKTEKIF